MTEREHTFEDLATKMAMHEMLLQRLFFEDMRRHSDPQRSLMALRESLVNSFDPGVLAAGAEGLTEAQQLQIQQQSAVGKEMSEEFIGKLANFL